MKYNIRGWLKEINDINTLGADLFAFKINYNAPDTNFVGNALFNGNISQTLWKSVTDNTIKRYGYDYDALNRLKDAKYYAGSHAASTNRYNEHLIYDKNGNITNLTRRGSHNAFNQVIDLLTYQYNGNQLQNVVEDPMGNASAGFIDGNIGGTPSNLDYLYDAFGNMTIDNNKKITNIRYNHLNLPTEIVFEGISKKINYTYNAAGVKVIKNAFLGLNDLNELQTSSTLYLGGYQYNNNVLQFFPHVQGYVRHNVNPNKYEPEYDYVYQYKDHLGNIRINYTFDLETSSLKILEENHYYPFGLKHTDAMVRKDIFFEKEAEEDEEWLKKISIVSDSKFGVVVPNSGYQYRFNSKEWQDELSLNVYDYGARRYDPAVGRWLSMDPLAEKYETLSPYNYVSNNPVNAIDPDGRLIVYVNGLLFSQALGMKLTSNNYRPERWGTQIQTNGLSFNGKAINYWDVDVHKTGITTRGEINRFFGDEHNVYVNGSHHFRSKASDRFEMGKKAGNELIAQLQNGTIELTNEETIKIVGHSQGAAHAAGMLTQLLDSEFANRLEAGIYLSPHQPGGFSHPDGVFGAQFSTKTDRVSSRAGVLGHLMELFNGSSELKEIKGSDFLMIRPEHKGNKGGHDAESWNNILKQINDFLNN